MDNSGDYISREAAVELLSQPITMSMCLSVEECHHKIAQQCIDRYLVENIPAADVRPSWISVEERLPEEKTNPNTRDFEYVLCTTIWGDVRPFKYGTPIGQKDAHFWNGAGYVDAYVTHWMPLPEPPKEG